MITSKQALWRQYYAAVKAGKKVEAEAILKRIHQGPKANPARGGGCSKCRKRF